MILSFVYLLIRALLRAFLPRTKFDMATEAELLVLRHQLIILRRQVGHPKLRRRDRMVLAAASRAIPKTSWNIFLVTPQTILRWHRDLVRRKWTYQHRTQGRPPMPPDIRDLIVRLAKDNPLWGYQRIQGELKKVGICVAASTVKAILLKEGLGPAPRRNGPTWRQFLKAQAQGIVACDFFTLETAWLRTVYVFFFIHVGTRRVLLVKATAAPNSDWVVQQARNLTLGQPDCRVDFIFRDRDAKYSKSFDDVFRSENAEIIKTPIQAPNANVYAERFVRTVRQECLDHILIISSRHLESVLAEFVAHYNRARPHRGWSSAHPSPAKSSHRRSMSLVSGARTSSMVSSMNMSWQHDESEFSYPSRKQIPTDCLCESRCIA